MAPKRARSPAGDSANFKRARPTDCNAAAKKKAAATTALVYLHCRRAADQTSTAWVSWRDMEPVFQRMGPHVRKSDQAIIAALRGSDIQVVDRTPKLYGIDLARLTALHDGGFFGHTFDDALHHAMVRGPAYAENPAFYNELVDGYAALVLEWAQWQAELVGLRLPLRVVRIRTLENELDNEEAVRAALDSEEAAEWDQLVKTGTVAWLRVASDSARERWFTLQVHWLVTAEKDIRWDIDWDEHQKWSSFGFDMHAEFFHQTRRRLPTRRDQAVFADYYDTVFSTPYSGPDVQFQ